MKASAVLPAAAVLLWMPFSAHAEVAAKVLSIQGRVEVLQSTWTPAAINQMLEVGVTIRTLDQSRAVILLTDETQIKLNSNSQLQLRETRKSSDLLTRVVQAGTSGSDQSLLNLLKGEAWLRSKKTPAQLKVNTPSVTAAIRGTEFDIQVADDGETWLTVMEGSVDFRNDAGFVLLKSREQGRARIGQAPTKTIILNPDDAVQWTFFYTAAVSPRDYPFAAATRSRAQAAMAAAAGNPLRTAELQHDAGNLPQALETLQILSGPEAAAIRGWIYLEQNRIPEAIQELKTAPAQMPRVRLGLSLAYFRMNQPGEAYALVRDPGDDDRLKLQKATQELLAGDAATARVALESVSKDSAAYALAQGLLANVYLVQNKKEEALAAALRAVAADPNSPSAYLSLSLVQQSRFDLPAATRSVQQALRLDPGFLQAAVQHARLLFGAGNSAKALELISNALALAPQDALAHSTLGFIQLGRGKTAEARATFEQALQHDNTQAEPHMGLGIADMREGRYADAVTEFLTAASLEPRLSLYQTYMGKAFYEQRKFEQAFSALQAAKELDPRDPSPLLYSGIMQNDMNNPGAAMHDLEESIRLNDNRAVYRSRYVLDEDRATRNVNLAAVYNRLGFSEWANLHALRSSLSDSGNSSAHLFLARTFLSLKGRTQAAGGELLLARLLLPVNSNSFNAFNDYTTLFELPRAHWSVEGTGGNFNSRGSTLVASGGAGRWAYSSALGTNRTQGFRPQNDDQRDYTGVGFLKFALTPHSDMLFSYVHAQGRSGDHASAIPLVAEDNNSETLRAYTRTDRAEIGYHQQFRPGSELVAVFSAQQDYFLSEDPKAGFIRIPPYPPVDLQDRYSSRRPNLDLQIEHLFKVAKLQLRYGMDIFEGRSRLQENYIFKYPPNPQQLIVQELEPEKSPVRYKTAFVQSDYPVHPKLTLTAGLNYDWASTKLVSTEADKPVSRWNPQAGFLFTPTDSSTIRFSYMRVMQTHQQERLAPTHVVGFAVNQNEYPLTESRSFNLGWDQRWGTGTFVRTTVFKRDRSLPYSGTLASGEEGRVYFAGDLYGGAATWNQLLTEHWTLVPEYSLAHNRDGFGIRHDHEMNLGLRYIGQRGLMLEVKENYLNQHGLLAGDPTRTSVFTTNASIAYEFPRKTGLLALRVSNLTDRRYSFLADPLALDPRIPRRQFSVLLRFNL